MAVVLLLLASGAAMLAGVVGAILLQGGLEAISAGLAMVAAMGAFVSFAILMALPTTSSPNPARDRTRRHATPRSP
jgi:zinc transporter ZupT